MDTLSVIVLYIAPICATLALNIITSSRLRVAFQRRAQTLRASSNSKKRTEVYRSRRTRTNIAEPRATNISFAVCWLVFFIIELIFSYIFFLKDFHHSIYDNNNDLIFSTMSELAVQLNIAFNPVLYVLWNPKFRQHLYRVGSRMVTCASCRQTNDSVPLDEL